MLNLPCLHQHGHTSTDTLLTVSHRRSVCLQQVKLIDAHVYK